MLTLLLLSFITKTLSQDACQHHTYYEGGQPLYGLSEKYNITSRWDWFNICHYVCQLEPECNYITDYFSSMNPSCTLLKADNTTYSNDVYRGRILTTVMKRDNYQELCSLALPTCNDDTGCCFVKDDILYGVNLTGECVHYNSNYSVKLPVSNKMIFHYLNEDPLPHEIEQYSDPDCTGDSYLPYDSKQCILLDYLNREVDGFALSQRTTESNAYKIIPIISALLPLFWIINFI